MLVDRFDRGGCAMRAAWRHACAGLIAVLCMAAVPFSARAQDEVAQVVESKSRIKERVEEITVTARRQEESIQETPIAVSSFGVQDLADRNVTSLGELSAATPNLNAAAGGLSSGFASRIHIRGVGQGDFILVQDPAVGVYLDGVYIARMQGGLFDLIDIERIEVLRGPQGTLFGRNTIGGALNVTSQKPDADFHGRAKVGVANLRGLETRAMVNFPILEEKIFARLSVATGTRDGYYENRFTGGDEFNDRKMLAGRAQLRFLLGESVDWNLSFDRTRSHERRNMGTCTIFPESGMTPTDGQSPIGIAHQNFLWGTPGYEVSFYDACQRSGDTDEFKAGSNMASTSDFDVWGTGSHLEIELAPDVTLKSITAWRRQENKTNQDIDGTEVTVAEIFRDPSQTDQVSQELLLTGMAFEGRVKWTGGLYYMRETGRESEITRNLPGADILAPGLKLEFVSALFGGVGPMSKRNRRDIVNLSYAAYGQMTFNLLDPLDLTLGLRRTHERKEATILTKCAYPSTVDHPWCSGVPLTPGYVGPSGILGDVHASERWGAWSPMVNLSYRVTDDVMLYGTWSRGFKSGGFNGRDIDDPIVPLLFDPEDLIAYELGMKSTWLENRVVLNVAAYVSKYEDMQITSPTTNATGQGVATPTRNAAKATMQGVELEVTALPTAGLTLQASLGFAHAEYDDFTWPEYPPSGGDCGSDPVVGGICQRDFSSWTLMWNPGWNYSVSGQYVFALGDMGEMLTRLDWSSRGREYQGLTNDRANLHGKYGLLNGRLAWMLADGKTEIAVWGKNLFDRRYRVATAGLIHQLGIGVDYYAIGRTYGLEISREF
jgi:iron complex outermembrane receptor protein